MSINVTKDVSLGNIMMAATFLLGFGAHAVAWAWHEAGQTKDIDFLLKQVAAHNLKSWHDGAREHALRGEARDALIESKLDTTNQYLEGIRDDVNSLLRPKLRRQQE